jgi:transcriptional regulator with XRE-family HTH domain
VTIGEALAEARYQAGLTVDELSERTKIREAVIRCIEQDDYAACGGDLYVRGYVRALAGAVGIDAQPLIRDFDAGRAGAPASTRNVFAQDMAGSAIATVPEPPTVIDMPPVTDPDFTIADPEFSIADPDFGVADPEFGFEDQEFPALAEPVPDAPALAEPVPDAPAPAAPAPAAPAPAAPAKAAPAKAAPAKAVPGQRQPSAWRARTRSRRWVTGVAILVVIALAVAGFAGSRIVAHLRQHNTAGNAASIQQQKAASQAKAAQAAQAAQAARASASAAGKSAPGTAGKSTGAKKPAKHTAPKASPAQAVSWLPIKLAMSFGPDGTSDGDNPQSALNAIVSGAPAPWQTDWYVSPEFGMLKRGTGLLLDMGKTVTVTSLRIDLSPYRGANLQLKLGNTPSGLRVAAHASDVGGTVRLVLSSPLRARYVLIWFTLLPPNGAGTYQESVSRVVVNGLR